MISVRILLEVCRRELLNCRLDSGQIGWDVDGDLFAPRVENLLFRSRWITNLRRRRRRHHLVLVLLLPQLADYAHGTILASPVDLS